VQVGTFRRAEGLSGFRSPQKALLGRPQLFLPLRNVLVACYPLVDLVRVGDVVPKRDRLTVTSAPPLGAWFRSPNGAAKAVVAALKPGVTPNRSGYDFWFVAGPVAGPAALITVEVMISYLNLAEEVAQLRRLLVQDCS
jgi:hypothetical protein